MTLYFKPGYDKLSSVDTFIDVIERSLIKSNRTVIQIKKG